MIIPNLTHGQQLYVFEKELRGQERDIAKYWRKDNIRMAFVGVEDQTSINQEMPLRTIGYDGAAYRSQLLEKQSLFRAIV